jgi:hypothetical protein
MPLAACLADVDVGVVDVAYLAYRRHAVAAHHPVLAGWHPDLSHLALSRHELGLGPGATDELCAFARMQFDVVYDRADRDRRYRQCVARLNVSVF